MLIELYSKYCSSKPLTLLASTRINNGGWVQHRTSERLTGIGLPIPSRLLRSSRCRALTSPRLTVTRPLCRTPCTNTPSTPSTHLSQLPTSIGRQRSDIRTTLTAQTHPLTPRPYKSMTLLYLIQASLILFSQSKRSVVGSE